MLAAVKDIAYVASLGIGHVADHAVLECLGKTDHGIERRAQLVGHGGKKLGLHVAGVFQLDILFFQRPLETLALGYIAGCGEDPLELAVTVMKGRSVVGHHGFSAVVGAHGEFVVTDLVLAEHALDRGIGTRRVSEEILAGRTDQLIAGAPGQGHHLLVDVGNYALRISHHQCIDVRFDQRAGIELLVPQALIQQGLSLFFLLARSVVGADQQITDDGFGAVAQ